jgi:hypothetical protein
MQLLYEGALLAVLVVWWSSCATGAPPGRRRGGPAAVGDPHLHRHVVVRLHPQHRHAAVLALVVGILVDDAIVEIENIARHLRMGKTPLQAAMEAADEIGMAVIATTFALVAVFLPTAFMAGIAGKFFKQFGWTAAVLAVFASLVVARLLTPMMAAYLLRPVPPTRRHVPDGRIMRGYLAACLVPAPPLPHRAGGRRVLRRLGHAGAAAAHRLRPPGRPARPWSTSSCPRAAPEGDLAAAEQARALPSPPCPT